ELDGRQDRAHHRHRASEIQDRHDEPRLQHPPAGSARANGSCTRLSALTGGVRVASCKGPTPARRQNGPRSGTHLGTSAATARSAKTEIAESEYCSRFPPSLIAASSQRGLAPRPAQLSPDGLRYFGGTFLPFNALPPGRPR